MPRYVAFLRAVNVGGRIVKMDELRRHFEAAGFADVETFIASGNVVFTSSATSPAAIEKKIEAHLAKALGFPVPTFVRTLADVEAATTRRVFPAADIEAAEYLLVGFLKGPLGAAGRRDLAGLSAGDYVFKTSGAEVYWLLRIKQSRLKLSPAKIERALGGPATFRAMSSLLKLLAKHGGPH